MNRPLLLDLFCGAGGAATGYSRAGFAIFGVDHRPQPRYPFAYQVDDALAYLHWLVAGSGGPYWLGDFAAIHASPPCQAFSQVTRVNGPHEHVDLIDATRQLLNLTGLPWIIENVPGAPLVDPVLLCGSMFDPPLDVRRHRHFESNVELQPPDWPCRHRLWGPRRFPVKLSRTRQALGWATASSTVSVRGSTGNVAGPGGADLWRRAMEIDWMSGDELAEAIPPRYTEFLGAQLVKVAA